MNSFKIYMLKCKKMYYFILDKISKKKYRRKYPKYLHKLGVHIEYKDIGDTWISPKVFFDSSGWDKIYIGKDVVISFDVVLLTHDGAIINAARYVDEKIHMKELITKEIHIGNNVFIGARSIILPGTVICDNVIVGAGSVVSGLLESGYVYSGVPATKKSKIENYFNKYDYLEREYLK